MSKTNGLPATTPYHGATPDILERPPPAKASVGVVCRRTRQDRSVRGEMSIRPASHALLDPRDDLAGNSTVEALALSLEYTSHAVWLKDFRLVAIESLPVRDEFYQPLSWRLSMGYGADKYRVIAGDKSAGDVDFGFGMTHSFLGPFLGYVMVIGRAGFADAFDAGYALGPGAAIGTIWPWGKRFRAMAEVNATRFYAGDAAFISEVKIEVSQRTGKRSSLDLLARTQSSADAHVTELIAKINYYF